MDRTDPPEAPGLQGLELESALQLLQLAGHDAPQGQPGSASWMQELVDALVNLSSRDPLTGLANRRAFDVAIAREIDRVTRSGEPALLLVLDIDHFKKVNDQYGHAAGDQVLRAVASALVETVRPMDLVARVGGEEFCIILPNCPSAFGLTVAERVRARVARDPVISPSGQRIEVTASLGGAYAPQWVRSTPTVWYQRADTQLYRAKASGRNRVCLEETPQIIVSAEEKGLLFAPSAFQEFE